MTIRRPAPDLRSNTFRLSECVIDPRRNRITRDNECVRVEPKVMDLLVVLCRHPGEVVGKDELFRTLWPETFVTEHVLTHAVWQLRQALGNPGLIESIPKRGYRLSGELHLSHPAPSLDGSSPALSTRFGVAVLPLANLSGDPAQEYFSDGMTEALILRLAQIQSLRVISRMSIMRYKNRAKATAEVRAELNVDAVIEGSVFRYGNCVRISVELIDTQTDTHLWAGSYEREVANVIELQSEMATAIARNVTSVLDVPAPTPVAIKPEAYEAYLRGRFCWFRFSTENFDAALNYFQLAAKLDPNFSPPLSGISQVWFARENSGLSPAEEAVPLAREAARRALALDDMSAGAHAALGLIKFHYDWDWHGAEDEFRRSIELDPSDAGPRIFLSDVLMSTGRFEQGFDQINFGLQIDPLNPACRCFLGWYLVFSRRAEEAIRELQNLTRTEPAFGAAHQALWGAFFQLKNWGTALQHARTFFSIRGDGALLPLDSLQTDEEAYRAAMHHAASTLVERSKTTYVPNLRIARLFSHGNDYESAFHYLEAAFAARESPLIHLAVAWDWDNITSDPRFVDLLTRIGLTAPSALLPFADRGGKQ
jgi:TolB-like protein